MTINFDKKIYGLRSGKYINKKINIYNEYLFNKLNCSLLNIFLSKIKEEDIIYIYLRYSYNLEFKDNIYNYMWIKINKNILLNIKHNLPFYI